MSGSTHESISQLINQRLDAKPTVGGRGKMQRNHATRGVSLLLNRMSVEEFDAFLAGDISAEELHAKHGVQR